MSVTALSRDNEHVPYTTPKSRATSLCQAKLPQAWGLFLEQGDVYLLYLYST